MSLRSTTWCFEARTPIWTGDIGQKNDDLKTPGLLGSVRWWFEVLVRGLGGAACDPRITYCRNNRHCVVCELFGCTGWARKFRFDVLNDKQIPQKEAIRAGETFFLRFTPFRPVQPEEWRILNLALHLIANYGAIGGKSVFKPSDQSNRSGKLHHQDFGLITCISSPDSLSCNSIDALKRYVTKNEWNKPKSNGFSWASIQNMWFVPGLYLSRQDDNQSTYNAVIGRPELKRAAHKGDSWLAGRRAGKGGYPESKKVFSFKYPEDVRRTFGFAKDCDHMERIKRKLEELKRRTNTPWKDFDPAMFKDGERILTELLEHRGMER
jgi:CRISPR-associated protein Cmr1